MPVITRKGKHVFQKKFAPFEVANPNIIYLIDRIDGVETLVESHNQTVESIEQDNNLFKDNMTSDFQDFKTEIRSVTETRNPTTSDFAYDLGTLWYNSDLGLRFILIENTEDAAKWEGLLFVKYSEGDPDPLDLSYEIGTIWKNYSTGGLFILKDIKSGKSRWTNMLNLSNSSVVKQFFMSGF